jgi:hypothetical protein
MTDDTKQLIAIAVVTVAQIYVTEPNKIRETFARFWDFIAVLCGEIANALGFVSMQARQNYYEVVNSYDY